MILTEREKEIAIEAMKFMYRILNSQDDVLDELEEWQERDVERHYINDFINQLK